MWTARLGRLVLICLDPILQGSRVFLKVTFWWLGSWRVVGCSGRISHWPRVWVSSRMGQDLDRN
jgi:hypothetical protein